MMHNTCVRSCDQHVTHHNSHADTQRTRGHVRNTQLVGPYLCTLALRFTRTKSKTVQHSEKRREVSRRSLASMSGHTSQLTRYTGDLRGEQHSVSFTALVHRAIQRPGPIQALYPSVIPKRATKTTLAAIMWPAAINPSPHTIE